MAKCVYCGKMYEPPRGMTIVTNKGGINTLCSSKCRKNMEMKRRKVRWVVDKLLMVKSKGKKSKKKTKVKKKK